MRNQTAWSLDTSKQLILMVRHPPFIHQNTLYKQKIRSRPIPSTMMFMYLSEGLVLNLKEHIIMLRALIKPKTNAEEQLRIQNAN